MPFFHPPFSQTLRAVPAVMRRVFGGAFVEFLFIGSGTEVELGALVNALVFGRAFYRFVLLKIGNWIIALDRHALCVHGNPRFLRFSKNRQSVSHRLLHLPNWRGGSRRCNESNQER